MLTKLKLLENKLYNINKKKHLKNKDFTIISSNCIGGIIYHDLGLPFLTPTVNLSFDMNDFVKFVSNLKYYIDKDLIKLDTNKEYPIGVIEDIKINFIHYKTFEEAKTKWDERKQRINYDNLFIIGTDKDNCTYETLKAFENLPYENKIIFTHIDYSEISSSYCIKGFEDKNELGVITNFKERFLMRRYLDDFDYVSFLNNTRKGYNYGRVGIPLT